ncbi:MAG: zinc ribbon domain-containing protein [Deltaproteobacteria bacterium]|nr:MAG: zinc ribbon domain-containing protein [Deltaproteobacteria bacterium]
MRKRELGRYQMLWDCPFCGAEKLLGIDHRHCPGCGAPQDPERRYFPPEGEEIAVEDHPFHGADKLCPACSSPNAAIAGFCVNCGSPLGEAATAKKVDEAPPPLPTDDAPDKKRKRGCALPLVLLVFVGAFIACVGIFLWKKEAPATVTGHTWERTIEVERYTTVEDSAWRDEVPTGARIQECHKEQRGTERVQDGETCRTVKKDNGDGTFTKVEECEPKYVDKPVQDDRCTYELDQWVTDRTERATGNSVADTPHWPEVTLSPKEREGQRTERYVVTFDVEGDDASCSTSQERWQSLAVGSRWTAKVGVITDTIDCDHLEMR